MVAIAKSNIMPVTSFPAQEYLVKFNDIISFLRSMRENGHVCLYVVADTNINKWRILMVKEDDLPD